MKTLATFRYNTTLQEMRTKAAKEIETHKAEQDRLTDPDAETQLMSKYKRSAVNKLAEAQAQHAALVKEDEEMEAKRKQLLGDTIELLEEINFYKRVGFPHVV